MRMRGNSPAQVLLAGHWLSFWVPKVTFPCSMLALTLKTMCLPDVVMFPADSLKTITVWRDDKYPRGSIRYCTERPELERTKTDCLFGQRSAISDHEFGNFSKSNNKTRINKINYHQTFYMFVFDHTSASSFRDVQGSVPCWASFLWVLVAGPSTGRLWTGCWAFNTHRAQSESCGVLVVSPSFPMRASAFLILTGREWSWAVCATPLCPRPAEFWS